MKRKIFVIIAAAVASATVLASCGKKAEPVKEKAPGLAAFERVLASDSKSVGFHGELSHYGFALSSGEKFEWSKDMGANKADLAMVMPAKEFIDAGLDVTKLDPAEWLFVEAEPAHGTPALLIKTWNVADEKGEAKDEPEAMEKIAAADKDILAYHEEKDHFALFMGEGYEVVWADDLKAQPEDLVFVLKAEPLVDAGLDIAKLESFGWSFKAASNDNMGMGANPDQIVKSFDLVK
ncbi:hypothetical protein [Youngiibacter multivorans]|uniref:Lipoprotein n=1 Tax=Youngiibacter multivorans TaxID=937251 RepID=A0ABS4G6W0_9CLOT|nr:hypothetical protein [Youngiibacter multivorans]MBP1920264.1 hypothetical protein [Youngiibacter multivorans]